MLTPFEHLTTGSDRAAHREGDPAWRSAAQRGWAGFKAKRRAFALALPAATIRAALRLERSRRTPHSEYLVKPQRFLAPPQGAGLPNSQASLT